MLENVNMPALDMIKALGATKRSKFIHMWNQYIKQTVREKGIILKHTASVELEADLFNKELERTR